MTTFCDTCGQTMAQVESIGGTCYLCILKKGLPQGPSNATVYRKAVAVALALATPLTARQARRVVRIVWRQYRDKDQSMRLLARIRDGLTEPFKPRGSFYCRILEVLR